jgi:bile acid:Na+ symporter, BASS family
MMNNRGLRFFLKEYTWLVILLAIGLGLLAPTTGMVIKPYVSYLLMGLMFLSGVSIDFARSVKHLKKVRKVIVSLLVIHFLSVLLVWCLRGLFSPEIFLGLMLAAAMPVGVSVIFLAGLYGGSTAKALVIAFLSNLVSPLLVPVVVWWLAGVEIKVDSWSMFWTITSLIIIPLVLARLVALTRIKKVVEREGTYLSVGILFLLIWGVIAPVSRILVLDMSFLQLFLVVLMLVLVNLLLGMWLGSDWKAKKTYGIVLSYKNFSLAMVLALSLFGPQVALPAVVYALVNNLLLVLLQWRWKEKS